MDLTPLRKNKQARSALGENAPTAEVEWGDKRGGQHGFTTFWRKQQRRGGLVGGRRIEEAERRKTCIGMEA